MIIGILNQKGGVGKTTISISVAHALALKSNKNHVLVVDADSQESALSWSDFFCVICQFSPLLTCFDMPFKERKRSPKFT